MSGWWLMPASAIAALNSASPKGEGGPVIVRDCQRGGSAPRPKPSSCWACRAVPSVWRLLTNREVLSARSVNSFLAEGSQSARWCRHGLWEDGGVHHSTDSPQWQRDPATSSHLRNDAVIAVGLFCLSVLTLALGNAMDLYEDPAGPVVSLLCLMLITLPLALRRARPASV